MSAPRLDVAIQRMSIFNLEPARVLYSAAVAIMLALLTIDIGLRLWEELRGSGTASQHSAGAPEN